MKKLPKVYSYPILAIGFVCIGISLAESRTFIDLLFTLLGSGLLIWGTYIYVKPDRPDQGEPEDPLTKIPVVQMNFDPNQDPIIKELEAHKKLKEEIPYEA